MLQRIRQLFRPEGQAQVATPDHEPATFILRYGNLEVGSLHLREGEWMFEYSPSFRDQLARPAGVQPLLEFPDVQRTYRSAELWPFFLARIPSAAQPQVQEEIDRRGLDATNAAQLLKAFGERSIANPFLLLAA